MEKGATVMVLLPMQKADYRARAIWVSCCLKGRGNIDETATSILPLPLRHFCPMNMYKDQRGYKGRGAYGAVQSDGAPA